MMARMRVVERICVAVLVLVLTAACGGTTGDRPASRDDLDASVAQFRTDEGTGALTAGITNGGTQTVHVTAASIRWGGLRFPVVRLDGRAVPPGQTAVFRTSYDAAACGRRVSGAPVVLATVDGRRTRLALVQDDPTLLGRLHASTCARQRLDDVAALRLVAGTSLEPRGSGFVLPATLVLTRRAGSTEPVSLVDLGGSVLLSLTLATDRAGLPVVLQTGQQQLRVPVTFGATGRCDAHSLGQSQQTFLLSAYVRLAGEPVQREVLGLSRQDRALLQSVIDRSCRAG